MDDLRHVEVESKTVLRPHGDGLEFLIIMMGLRPRGPVQNDIRRRHQLDFHHSGIDGMLARIERSDPDTLMAYIDQVAMFEFEAAYIHVRLADKRNDHPDIADGNLHHRQLLDLHEPWVEVPG